MSTGETARKSIRVVGSMSMESVVQALAEAVPSIDFAFEPVQSVSLESQQMDEVAREEALQNLKAQLEQSLRGDRPTGALQLFLLGGGGVAASDPESQATLRALAKAALQDPSNTVAALLPEDVKSPDDIPSNLPAAVRAVVTEFLGATEVPVFHDTNALAAHLSST